MFRNRRNQQPEHNRDLIRQDFVAYQEAVVDELRSAQNKVRHLIGRRHWLTDGEHKESVIRNILRLRLPETMRVGRGFVCYPNEGESSGQIDILIAPKYHPVLYREGELIFVTATPVKAIAEVKTLLRAGQANGRKSLTATLKRLADQIQFIRGHGNSSCWCGLFVYEDDSITHENLLRALQESAEGLEDRVVDCVSVGDNMFAHFWQYGREQVESPVDGPVWHTYHIHRLTPAYFISNIVVHVSPDIPDDEQVAWFPIEGGKETQRRCYIPLGNGHVSDFL